MKISLLKQKNFFLLMLGKIVSLIGSQLQTFALSLYVLKITGSATQFAGILSVMILPQVILGPFIGVLVDWFDRKKIIVSLDMFNGVFIGVYAAIYFSTGKLSLGSIYVLAIVLSIVSLMFQPAISTVIPSIMKKDDIAESNAINSTIMSIGQLISPMLAGVLFGLTGLGMILIINSISFILSSISEMFIDIPKNILSHEKVNLKVFKNDFVEGFKFIKTKQLIFAAISMAAVLNLTNAPISELGCAYVSKQILKVSDFQYSMLNSAGALAMIIAPLCIGRLMKKMSTGKLIYISDLLCGIAICMIMIVPTDFFRGLFNTNLIPYTILLFLIFVCAFLITIGNIACSIMAQTEVPLELMGRVGTVCAAICMSAMPLGQMMFGLLFDRIPAWICYAASGCLFVVTTLLFKNKLLSEEKGSSKVNCAEEVL